MKRVATILAILLAGLAPAVLAREPAHPITSDAAAVPGVPKQSFGPGMPKQSFGPPGGGGFAGAQPRPITSDAAVAPGVPKLCFGPGMPKQSFGPPGGGGFAGAQPPPVAWDKTVDGEPWEAGMEITRQTSDTIVVQEVLHLAPPPVLTTGTPGPWGSAGRLYLTALDVPLPAFAAYDPAIDRWTTLAPYETGCQMAVDGAGRLYAYGFDTGTIDRYLPASDSWTPVMPVPPGASGRFCNLEVTNDGEFLYTEGMTTTLWHTEGGAWITLTLPFVGNVLGDYDPTADQYVVGERNTTNAYMIDVHNWAITPYSSPLPGGEWVRFGAILDGRFYFQFSGSALYSFDLGSPALPPLDHGVNPPYAAGAAADRSNAAIYTAGFYGMDLFRYDPATNSLTPLTGYTSGTEYSSLAYTALPTYAQVETWDPAKLQLVDWTATGGRVTVEPDRVAWTGPLVTPEVVTLTKWFHVEPCTWTQALLQEELWLDDVELEQRPVVVDKQPPALWIDEAHEPLACPGAQAHLRLDYGNQGGFENDAVVRGEFPAEALLAGSDPPPDAADPGGRWAEWWVGDLANGAAGQITATVAVTAGTEPGQAITVTGRIVDHVGEAVDGTAVVFEAVAPVAIMSVTYDGAGPTVTFTAVVTGFPPISYLWNFGDGAISTETNPVHSYAGAGCYSATLDVANTCGPDGWSGAVCVEAPCDPVHGADFTWLPLDPGAGQAVVLTGSTAGGTAPFSYTWSFGDDGTGAANPISHTYALGGAYTVVMTATNGCSSSVVAHQVAVRGEAMVYYIYLPLVLKGR